MKAILTSSGMWRSFRLGIAALLLMALLSGTVVAAEPAGPPAAPQGVWIGPGVSYQLLERVLPNGVGSTVRGGIVRINPDQTRLEFRPSLALEQLQERERLSDQAARHGSSVVAGINGDFFYNLSEAPGAPIGLLIRDGELLSSGGGAAFGIDQGGRPVFGRPAWSGTITIYDDGGNPIQTRRLCAVNKPRSQHCLVLYTDAWGATTNTNEWGTEVTLVVDPGSLPLRPSGTVGARVVSVHRQTGNSPLGPGMWVLSGHSAAGDFLASNLVQGRYVEISLEVSPPWDAVVHAIGGGPILVENGRPAELPDDNLARRRAARTAVGIDQQGNWLWLVVDGGNSTWSAGVTLAELQQLLLSMGVQHAINLDGGGSSTLLIRQPGTFQGRVVNRPSDGSERRIGPAWLAISRVQAGPPRFVWAEQPTVRLLPQAETSLRILAQDANYEPVRLQPEDVQWALTNSPDGNPVVRLDWNGGNSLKLTAMASGQAEIKASLPGMGEFTVATVQVVGPGEIARVVVRPDPAQLKPGSPVRFQATVYDANNKEIAAGDGSFVWTGTGDFATITRDGEFVLASENAVGTIEVALKTTTADGEERLLPIHSQQVVIGNPIVYSDMTDHWAAAEVSSLSGRGIVRGYPDGTFGPQQQVTRAEFGTMLVRALEAINRAPAGASELVPGDEAIQETIDRFTDGDALPEWALGALAYAVSNGLLGGYDDGTFKPNQAISRQEAAVIMSRIPGVLVMGADLSVYTDVDAIGQWALTGVSIATGAGLMQGYPDNTFQPTASITRAEAAVMIHRLLGLLTSQ